MKNKNDHDECIPMRRPQRSSKESVQKLSDLLGLTLTVGKGHSITISNGVKSRNYTSYKKAYDYLYKKKSRSTKHGVDNHIAN